MSQGLEEQFLISFKTFQFVCIIILRFPQYSQIIDRLYAKFILRIYNSSKKYIYFRFSFYISW
jgi:hypothetical protein